MAKVKRTYLTKCRKDRKLTRRELAVKLGISEVYVRMIENAAHAPGRDLMLRFQNFYNEPLEKLFPDLFESSLI